MQQVKAAHRTLNKKERMFVEAYCGDEVEAVQIAGYSGAPAYLKAKGNAFLKDPAIMEAIKDRSKYETKTKNVIATRDERMEMWTNIMQNTDPYHVEEKDASGIPIPETNLPMNMRLKASELLGKAEGDFIDRVDFSGKISISDIMLRSYEVDDKSIEDIEAEYQVIRDQKRLAKKSQDTDIPESPVSSLDDLI